MTSGPTSTSMDPGLCMFPPCVICGDRSSGYHYGAHTCEACKSFFRRCASRTKAEYLCKNNSSCTISPNKRQVCKSCRYKKCIQNGMSREGSTKGRYTLQKRNNNIRIVNSMEKQGKMKGNGRINPQYENNMKTIIDNLSNLSLYQTHTSSTLEELDRLEEEFLEQRELDQVIFGNIDHLGRLQCDHIYKSTGVDVDGFHKKVKAVQPDVAQRVHDSIAFAYSLSGFQDIPVQDQFALLTAAGFERWLFLNAHWTNSERYLMVHPYNKTVMFCHQDLLRLSGQQLESCELVWKIIERFQRLELLPEECHIVAAISLMTASGSLSEAAQPTVAKILDTLLDMLLHLLEQNHDPEEHTLARLMIILTDTKNLADLSFSLRSNLKESIGQLDTPSHLYFLLVAEVAKINHSRTLVDLELD